MGADRLREFIWFWFLHWGVGGKPPPGCLIGFALVVGALALLLPRWLGK